MSFDPDKLIQDLSLSTSLRKPTGAKSRDERRVDALLRQMYHEETITRRPPQVISREEVDAAREAELRRRKRRAAGGNSEQP